MTEDIYLDVNYLSESERDIILQVLSKDEELRKQEKRRISSLKNELDELKTKGATEEELSSSRICARCRSPLGLIFNSGSLCSKCQTRVCKDCRKDTDESWLCVLCAKIREVRAESGAWFYEHERMKNDRPQLYGSALVRASFRRSKPQPHQRRNVIQTDPGSPPVITLNLDNHNKLHRPVPVHMSRLTERDVEEEENNAVDEINSNYKQYSKASPVPRNDHEEEQSDEQGKVSSSSSRSSTPLGSPVGDPEVYCDTEDPEETVFDHLAYQISNGDAQKEGEDEEEELEKEGNMMHSTNHTHHHNIVNGYSKDEYRDYEREMNDWETHKREHTSDEDHLKDQPTVEVTTKWHEVAYEWSERGSSEQHDKESYMKKDFLDPRPASPDSETTGEFFTPLTTPLHSGPGTPAFSEHGQSEGVGSGSEYMDAGEATPVEGDETSEDDNDDNVGDVTVTNPEITAAMDDEEAEEGQVTPPKEDDIDQAFAQYEQEHPGVTTGGANTLKDQLDFLNMGSRESIVSYYSDAGEGRFGTIPVTGEILFGLYFNKKKQELEVQVHRAKDIAPADEKKGKSDPYVKVYLLPDKTKGGKRKSKIKKNTLNPDFDDILKFKVGFDEMLTRTLWLAVWNHDTFGHNDFLGEVMLPLDTYQESGFSWNDPSPNWYPLRDRRPEPSLMTYCGDMTVSLMFQPSDESHKDKKKKKKTGGRLHVNLKDARNLPSKDTNGFSDPFCKRSLPKLFDKSTKEPESESKSEIRIVEPPEVPPEHVPLVSPSDSGSHENLAFEEEKPLKPQDSSMESTESDKSQEVQDIEKGGDDSGIVVSEVNGKDVTGVEEGTTEDNHESHRDYQPVLKSIGTFAMQFMVASPPEIKVDTPKTLFSVATGDSEKPVAPANPPSQPSRRRTEHDIAPMKGKSTLSPLMATRRRHSDFAVSAPRPINEELAEKDMKRRGSDESSKTPVDQVDAKPAKRGSRGSPDVVRVTRGPQWSPRLERKKREDQKKEGHKQERRKTLAELAMEAGYTSSTDGAAEDSGALQVTKAEESTLKGSRESLMSDPDDENYSGIQVTGEIFVSLRYEMQSKKFEVHIHSANNLAAADAKKGSSDPYVKSYLLPDRRSKRKTKTKRDTVNPFFDEILEYFIGYDELMTRTLFLSVWHKTIGRNDFLGEVKVHMNDFLEAGHSLQEPAAKWFTLTEKSDADHGLPTSPSELVLALKYVTADKVKKQRGRSKGELHVHLLEARNLPGMDADGMSDPYCKCFLLPDKKGKSKHKTPTVKRTLNPSFDYKFACEEVSLDDLKERVLEIVIWDFDRASSDEFLGGVRLGLGTSANDWDDSTEDESQIWHMMLSRSNVWIQVVVPLRSSMTSQKTTSEVEVGN